MRTRKAFYALLSLGCFGFVACSGVGSNIGNVPVSGNHEASLARSRSETSGNSQRPFADPYDPVTSGYEPPKVDLHPRLVSSDPMFEKHLTAVSHLMVAASRRKRIAQRVHPLDTVSSQDSSGQGGYYIVHGSAAGDGDIWAAHDAISPSAASNVNLPSPTGWGNYLYAPTTHGPNGNCLESVTDYFNNDGTGTYYVFMIWNFCQSQNGYAQEVQIPMDSNFFNNYVRTYSNGDGRPEYQEEVYRDSNGTWHQLLYNNLLQRYDDVWQAPGTNTSNNQDGWSIFETHFGSGVTCPAIPTIGMSGLRLRVNGVWGYVSTSTSYSYTSTPADCFSSAAPPYYTLNYYSPDFAWTENDPSVPGTGAGSTGGGGTGGGGGTSCGGKTCY